MNALDQIRKLCKEAPPDQGGFIGALREILEVVECLLKERAAIIRNVVEGRKADADDFEKIRATDQALDAIWRDRPIE